MHGFGKQTAMLIRFCRAVWHMPKCPSCKKDVSKMIKAWKFGNFDVNAYKCTCQAEFRNYSINGKKKFTMRREGARYRKHIE